MISVENVSKRFPLPTSGGWYVSLRETVTAQMKRLFLRERAPSPSFFWALRDLSFTIAPGEALALIGKNGAGKSTLLKLLSRVTLPTSGKITLRGVVSSLLEVGVGFHAELTARENIYFNGALMGMSRGDVRKNFDAIVAFSGVEKFLEVPMKKFSSGMCARLGFAIGAHLPSDIFIVDEVLAVGDATFQKKCRETMRTLVAEGRTLLFVSHDREMVSSLCKTGIWLDRGRLLAHEPIGACLDRYEAACAMEESVQQAACQREEVGVGQAGQ